MKSLIHEIHRRSLWQVLAIYAGASWLVLQAVDTLAGALGLPEWSASFALFLLIVGLPVVLATAFVQEGMTRKEPETSRQSLAEADVDELDSAPATVEGGHRILTWRNALLGGLGAFALLGILTAGYLFMRSAGIGPAGTLIAAGVLDERDPILIADLVSGSGDPTLARTATAALRADIAESPSITLLSADRIAAALELMRVEPNAPIDLDVARQIAAREGVKAVVTGEVNAAGSGFVFTAQVVSTDDGEVLVSRRESAGSEDEVIDAIDRLSKGIRERLGESLRSVQSSPPLAQVTTHSFEALRLFQEGNLALNTGDRNRGVALLEEAVAIDPEFASAWRRLATHFGNPGPDRLRRSKGVEAATRAYKNLDRLTEFEQIRAETQYHVMVTGDFAKDVAGYERGLERWPEAVSFLNNLAVDYIAMERFEEAEELLRRAWDLDSVITFHHSNLFPALVRQGRLDAADSLIEDVQTRPYEFSRGRRAGLAASRNDWATIDSILDPDGNRGQWTVLARIRGQLGEAERIVEEQLAENERQRQGLGVLGQVLGMAVANARFRGQPTRGLDRVEDVLERYPLDDVDPLDRPYFQLAQLYAMAGDPSRARQFVALWEEQVAVPIGRIYTRGLHRTLSEIALAEGRADDAIEEQLQAELSPCRTLCPDLARVYDLAGRPDSALALYQRYVEHASSSLFRFAVRPLALERLGQLYDERDDPENAAKYYAMFVELWADADEDLQPRVRAAQTRLEEILTERG